jgi:AcrR family transcriptional regulator
MARTRDEQLAQERRDQITAAAVEVFGRRGFHGARTEEICAVAGVSPGTLFRHFKDKSGLIAAVVEAETQGYLALVDTAFSVEGFRAILGGDPSATAERLQPPTVGVSTESWAELARNPDLLPLAREADRRIRKAIAASVRAAQAAGVVRASLDPGAAAEMLNALFSGLLFDRELNPARDPQPVAEALCELLRRYLTDDSPA